MLRSDPTYRVVRRVFVVAAIWILWIGADSSIPAAEFKVRTVTGDDISGNGAVALVGELNGRFVFSANREVTRAESEGIATYEVTRDEERIFFTDGNSVHVVETPEVDYRRVSHGVLLGERYYFDGGVSGLLTWDGNSLTEIALPKSLRSGNVMVRGFVALDDRLLLRVQDQSRSTSADSLFGIDATIVTSLGSFKVNTMGDILTLDNMAIFAGNGSLYRTDGKSLVPIGIVNPDGLGLGGINHFAELNGELIFDANGQQGSEVFKTDGLTVEQIADINPSGHSHPRIGGAGRLGNSLFFSALGPTGTQLYRTDGEDVERISNFPRPGFDSTFGSSINLIDSVGGWLYFTNFNQNEHELYATDGTSLTRLDLDGLHRGRSLIVNDRLLMAASGNNGAGRLFSLHGTSETPIAELSEYTSLSTAIELNGEIIFSGTVDGSRGLFATDGTSVREIWATSELLSISNKAVTLGNLSFFRVGNDRLFSYDGTDANEVPINSAGMILSHNPFELNGSVFIFGQTDNKWQLIKVSLVPEPASLWGLGIAAMHCLPFRRLGRSAQRSV